MSSFVADGSALPVAPLPQLPHHTRPLLIVGASARAAAMSAQRAGFEPWCVDLFTDRDLQAVAHARRCPPERYPRGLIKKLWTLPEAEDVLLTGAMDHHLAVVAAINRHLHIVGCQVDQIASLRDPHVWDQAAEHPNVRYPQVFTQLPQQLVAGRFLWKPCDHDRQPGDTVREWSPDIALLRGYLQRYVEGEDLGAIYHAVGNRAVLLGATQQIVGEPRLKAGAARYAGSVGPVILEEATRQALEHLGHWLASQGLVSGLFGIDVRRDADGNVWPLEINPRYTASVEVLEHVLGIAALRQPIELLGPDEAARAKPLHKPGVMLAKGIAYSDRAMPAPPVADWFEPGEVADIPQSWRSIEPGSPICTLFAKGPTTREARSRLYAMADQLYTRLDHWPN